MNDVATEFAELYLDSEERVLEDTFISGMAKREGTTTELGELGFSDRLLNCFNEELDINFDHGDFLDDKYYVDHLMVAWEMAKIVFVINRKVPYMIEMALPDDD